MIGLVPARRVKVCREPGCGKTSDQVRFPAMSVHRCCSCDAKLKAAKASRIQARGARTMTVKRVDPGDNPKHRAWIASLPCAVCGPGCKGQSVPHHVRDGTGGGTSLKPGDEWCVPLCAVGHHQGGKNSIHQIGQDTFAALFHIDLRALAEELASLSPYLPTKQAA